MKRNVIDGEFIGRLETLSLYIGRPMSGLIGGGRKSRAYGSSVEFADFREYVPGDDLRRLDWNIYSRFEKYIIKLFTDERKLTNHIYIDCSESMQTGEPEKAELALKLAAAFGFLSVTAMDRVSYRLMADGKCTELCGTVSGTEGFYEAAALLSTAEFGGDTDLEAAIKNCPDPGYDNGVSIIISDLLTESEWKKAVDFLLFRKRDVLVVQILSPEELDPDLMGKTQLMDMEAADEEDVRHTKMDINRSIMEAYKTAMKEYLTEVRDFCASRGVGYMCVSGNDTIDDILYKKGYETGFVR